MPVASPTSAKLTKTITVAATTLRNGSIPSSFLAATVRISVRTSTGTRPVQNLD